MTSIARTKARLRHYWTLLPSGANIFEQSWLPASRSLSRAVSTTRTSTVHRGTAFEDRSLLVLRQHMSMSLRRVGGKEDGGIDLLGWWWLPHESLDVSATSLFKRRRIRVIGQCKAEKKKMGPNYVRELEGVLFRFFASKMDTQHISPALEVGLTDDQDGVLQPQLSGPVIALLISQSSFTKSTILRANSSPIPFCLLHIPELELATPEPAPEEPCNAHFGEVGAAWCNPALLGLPEVKDRMEIRWERQSGANVGRPALWWDGNPLPSWTPDSMLEKEIILPDDS